MTTQLKDSKILIFYVLIDIDKSFIRQNYLNYNEVLTNPLFENFNVKIGGLSNCKNKKFEESDYHNLFVVIYRTLHPLIKKYTFFFSWNKAYGKL